MKPFLFRLSLSLAIATTALSLTSSLAQAVEAPPAAPIVSTDLTIDDEKDHEAERKELESVLSTIESQWNEHDIKAVMSNYADDYVNNDGLGKKAVQKLTEDFWKTYPDAHAVSKTKQIRIDGNYATVESRDTSSAASEAQGMGKGELQSVSEGQQYFKRLGSEWKITGDRITYERVRLVFGLGKHLNATFTAPEQVKAGKQFSAKLEVTLPPGLQAIGSISNQPMTFPQHSPMEKNRDLGEVPVLERVMGANTESRNELLTATVILITPGKKAMGLSILTRRLNVVPDLSEGLDTTTAQESASDKDKVASQSADENKDAAKIEKIEKPGIDKTGPDKTGPDKTGPDKTGTDKTGTDKTGTDKTGTDDDKSTAPSK